MWLHLVYLMPCANSFSAKEFHGDFQVLDPRDVTQLEEWRLLGCYAVWLL
jgi:hypothetical protein